jgi:hypothetical protein
MRCSCVGLPEVFGAGEALSGSRGMDYEVTDWVWTLIKRHVLEYDLGKLSLQRRISCTL